MADYSLEDFQRTQSVRISKEIIGQSEKHEQKMQANWQKLWETAHAHLVTLFRFLDQDYDESCEKANHPLTSFSDDDLAYLIHIRIRAMQEELVRNGKPDETIELRHQIQILSQKNSELERSRAELIENNKKLQAENSGLTFHLSALQQAQRGVKDPTVQETKLSDNSPIPEWIGTWRISKTFEKMAAIIRVMGDTGMALRPSILKAVAKSLALSEENSSLDEAVSRLMTDEENIHPALIEQIEEASTSGSSSGGNRPDVLRLSESGLIAYQTLEGKAPKENEYDRLIRCHSSPEHTILNIQAVEILHEAGYRIQGQAQEIQLSNGETLIPDITAVDPETGEVIFVEVERDVHKDQASRKQKWMNIYEASNGNLFVFCDNISCQRGIQAEINIALNGLAYNSFLTNLHGLRNGKRSEKDGSIWLSMKRGK